MGSRAHTLEHILRVVVHTEYQHPGRVGRAAQTGGYHETRLIGHGDIQHHDIRPQPGSERQRLGATGGFADHLQVGLAFDDMPDSGPHDHVVIRDQYSDGFGRHAPFDGSRGTTISSCAPVFALPWKRTAPPSAMIRSRMPARPMWPASSSRSGLRSGGPRPSSPTLSRISSWPMVMATSTERAPACRSTFERPSCKARNSASSASRESGGITAGALSSLLMPLRWLKSATSERSAGRSPRSSS